MIYKSIQVSGGGEESLRISQTQKQKATAKKKTKKNSKS